MDETENTSEEPKQIQKIDATKDYEHNEKLVMQ